MATAKEYLDNFLSPEETTANEALAFVLSVCQDLQLPFSLLFNPSSYQIPQSDGSFVEVEAQEGYRVQIDSEAMLDEDNNELVYSDYETMVLASLNLLRYVLESLSAYDEDGVDGDTKPTQASHA